MYGWQTLYVLVKMGGFGTMERVPRRDLYYRGRQFPRDRFGELSDAISRELITEAKKKQEPDGRNQVISRVTNGDVYYRGTADVRLASHI